MNTSLVVTHAVVPYDYGNRAFDSLTIDEKLSATRQKKKVISSEIAAISSRLTNMSEALHSYTKESVAAIRKLREEIEELLLEQREAARKRNKAEDDSDLEDAFARFDEQRRAHEESYEDFATPPKAISKRAKSLFRQIAKRTHPDKTSDPEMHNLFRIAKDYYNSDNVEGLESVLQVLRGKSSSLFDRLFKALQEELSELLGLERQLGAIKESEDYQILQAFETNTQSVLEAVSMQSQMQIQMLRQNKLNLMRAMGKMPEHSYSSSAHTQFIFV